MGRATKDVLYHDHMHRLYRLVRAKVAQTVSPCHPDYAVEVRADFAERVKFMRLTVPPFEAEKAAT